MASDNSPPRIRAIITTLAIAFLILFGLKFVFDSYYVTMFEQEEYDKIGSHQSEVLIKLRADEKRNLTSAPVPIDRAMMMLAKSREEASSGMVDGGIIAEQSTDTNPLIGWGKLPHELTAAELAAGDAGATALAPTTDDAGVSATTLATDGGAIVGTMMSADAGVIQTTTTMTDGGAKVPSATMSPNALPGANRTPKTDAGSSQHP